MVVRKRGRPKKADKLQNHVPVNSFSKSSTVEDETQSNILKNHNPNPKRALSHIDINIMPVAKRGHPKKAEKALTIEKENIALYCYCNDVESGLMIECENQLCRTGCFHFK